MFRTNLQQFTNSRFAVWLALGLSRYSPRWLGYRIADLAAAMVASRQRSPMVRALRANQQVISADALHGTALQRRAGEVFRLHLRGLYDFYHNLDRPQEILRQVDFHPYFADVFERVKSGSHPALFLSPHTSNFDLAGRALALRGLDFQVLSFPQPPSGYQMQNRLRAVPGIEVTPMSVGAAQQARQRLRAGGVVLTGLDRPLADARLRPRFFGRPAPLPVAYAHLALHTGVPMYVVACVSPEPARYRLVCSPPIQPQPYPDRDEELIRNAESVLAEAEKIIAAYPQQWAMFYPVWPETLDQAEN
ncbi:MAG: lysophospholipid acyltransferase family protein [Bellilinea sp.]